MRTLRPAARALFYLLACAWAGCIVGDVALEGARCDDERAGSCPPGLFCNQGRCAAGECAGTADCLANACSAVTCEDGTCVYVDTTDAPGDCREPDCKSGLIPDDSDTPETNYGCFTFECVQGGPNRLPVQAGTPCADDGGDRCDGQGQCVLCLVDVDCPAETPLCIYGKCFPESCIVNGCGGNCPPCGDGEECSLDSDCLSGNCDQLECQPPTCSDGTKNQGESDIDCGGPCGSVCTTNDECILPADCESGVCNANTCQAPSCADGTANGQESDVDCGGEDDVCPRCGKGKSCNVDEDCASDHCITQLVGGSPVSKCDS